jgi:preprotein translocase subunit YajC
MLGPSKGSREIHLNLLTNLIVFAQLNLGGGSAPSAPVGGGSSAAAGGAGEAVAGGGAGGAASSGGGMEQLLFIGFMIAVFYFLLIRPQQKRAKKHKQMVTTLSAGDQVITNSGIFGKISAIDETSITLEVAKGTRIRVLKSFVGGIATPETEQQLAQQPQG